MSIVAVLVVNALIGGLTELKAARLIEALCCARVAVSARVRRDGHARHHNGLEEMPPGLYRAAGRGPCHSADLRLVEAWNSAADQELNADRRSLVAAHKHVHPVSVEARASRTQPSMLFKGTALTRGSGAGVVTA